MLLIDLFNPEELIRIGGITLLLIIVFAETGLFFGFFLPGDSLLFTAGLLCESTHFDHPVVLLIMLLIAAAVGGSCTGYFIGSWAQNYLHSRKDNFFYKRRYLDLAQHFYQRHGMMAFVAGRFLPIIRTFVPMVAGLIPVPLGRFLLFNVVGAVIWVVSLVLAGYGLGNLFPQLIHHLELVILGLIAVTTLPVFVSYWKNRNVFSR